MQAVKPTPSFRYSHYDIELKVADQRRLSLTVFDLLQRIEYHESECILETIGVSTLLKAFDQSKQEIKVSFSKTKVEQNGLLEVKVIIDSVFLKPVTEVILLKKVREVSQEETVKKSLDYLSTKVKYLKNSEEGNNMKTLCSATQEDKNFMGSTYESIASINLPKGKYLLTLNFLVKTTSQQKHFCFYFNEVPIDSTQLFDLPVCNQFVNITVRRVHTVAQETQNYKFQTNYANSYPATIRNAIITAKPLLE